MTPFSDVYHAFLSKITDRDLVNNEFKDEIMEDFLRSAIARFHHCEKDLSDTDFVLKQFNTELDMLEIEILARYMVIEWTDGYIQSEEFMKQKLGNRDYTNHSPANHLEKLMDLKAYNTGEASALIQEYYYRKM